MFLAIGVCFHLLLAATLELGMFPYAMLALYPAFFRGEEAERWIAGPETPVDAR